MKTFLSVFIYNTAMKQTGRNLSFLSLFLILASCATQPAVAPPPPVIQAPPEYTTASLPLSVPLAIPEYTETERVISMIKINSPAIRRFFYLDGQGEIHVRGELGGTDGISEHEIIYEFLEPLSLDASSSGRLYIGFTVTNIETGGIEQDSFYWPLPVSNAGILLSFDDDHEENWETWLDTLEKYGARATFFVHHYCTFAETALTRGHDIGFHTHQHLNLRNVSRDVFLEETSYNPEYFTVGRPMAFAYPYGLWQEWMHEELLQNYSVLRGYGVRFLLYDFDAISGSFISSTAIDNTLYRDDAEFERLLTRMLRTTKFLGGVLPLTTHVISDTAAWGIKTYRLLFLLETARSLNLNFYRFSDF